MVSFLLSHRLCMKLLKELKTCYLHRGEGPNGRVCAAATTVNKRLLKAVAVDTSEAKQKQAGPIGLGLAGRPERNTFIKAPDSTSEDLLSSAF